jgi:hypothetical protein
MSIEDQPAAPSHVTRKTVVRSSRSSRRPLAVTVLAGLLLAGGGLCTLLMGMLLWRNFDPRSGYTPSGYPTQCLLIITLLVSVILCVMAVGLLRRMSWARRLTRWAANIEAVCLVLIAYNLSPVILPSMIAELAVVFVLALLISLVPAYVLGRAKVRSWFRHAK